MANICLNILCGIPAAGKSTFCRRIACEAQTFNVLHICYDDFIRMPDTDDPLAGKSQYFDSKRYKRDRFSVKWLVQQLVDDIKSHTRPTDFHRFRLAVASEFPRVECEFKADATKGHYLLLIDDTMHYKSMRKEMRSLARANGLGYFVSYFPCASNEAIQRNRNRVSAVDEKHLIRMYGIIEPPSDDDGQIFRVDHDVDTNFVEMFALKCIESPLKAEELAQHPVVEQSVIHKADLVLRRSINQKMKSFKETEPMADLKQVANALCLKRLFVLQEMKAGRMDLPENLEALSNFI